MSYDPYKAPMQSGYPVQPNTMQQDLDHLKILSIFYYVFAGLAAVFSCVALIYPVIGIALIVAPPDNDPDAAIPGAFIIVIGLVVLALMWAQAALLYWTGRSLANQRNMTLCLIVAGLICLSVPLGTALGVFTFVVLFRPSVQELFNRSK